MTDDDGDDDDEDYDDDDDYDYYVDDWDSVVGIVVSYTKNYT